jgi:hypothetical protein
MHIAACVYYPGSGGSLDYYLTRLVVQHFGIELIGALPGIVPRYLKGA